MSRRKLFLLSAVAAWLLAGCGTLQALTGRGETGDSPKTADSGAPDATRWVLIQNLRYGGTTGAPEYVWVREDGIPSSATTFIFGKKMVVAPEDVVTEYVRVSGPPPDGGLISPAQGGPPRTPGSKPPAWETPSEQKSETSGAPGQPPGAPPLREATTRPKEVPPPRGYVVHVQARLVVVDLTAADGLHTGSLLAIRREEVPLTHPVTGESLGGLDEEIATARVIEVRERFSVAEINEVRPGFEVRVKDRVVLKRE